MNSSPPPIRGSFTSASAKSSSHPITTISFPLFEARIAAHGKISLVWEMRDFHGWSVEGLWADTKFDVRHAGDFSRVALVGETKWQEMMTSLMSPFTSAEVRFFETTDLDDALRWVEQPAER